MANHRLLPTSIILFLHVPISMFSAFSWVALFHNGFIILSQYGYENVEFAIVSALFLAIISTFWCITGIFSRRRRDFVFGLSTAWLLLGIGIQQSDTNLSTTCYVLASTQVMIIFFIIYRATLTKTVIRSADSGERENLLQHRTTHYGGIPVRRVDRGDDYDESDERIERENLFQNRIKFYGGIIVDNWYKPPISE